MKMTRNVVEEPMVEREKREGQVEGDVICYYYEPNHGERQSSIVVIDSKGRGDTVIQREVVEENNIIHNVQKPLVSSQKLHEKPATDLQNSQKKSSNT
jgi:hypothetical protein